MKRSYNVRNLIYYIFVFLFPIIPEFTIIAGRPSYEWIILIELISLLLLKHKIRDKFLLKKIFIGFLLYAIAYGSHGEWRSIITIMLDCFFVILVIYNEIDSEIKLERTFQVLVYGGIILSIEAVFEVITEYNIFSLIQTLDSNNAMGAIILGYRNGQVRAEGSFGQPLPFAMYLLFINFICILAFVRKEKSKKYTYKVYYVGYVLSILAIILTTGRMVLSLTLILQCIFILSLKPEKRILIITIGCIGLIGIIMTSPDALQIIYTIGAVFNPDYYGKLIDGGQNVAYRLQLFSALQKYIVQNPLFGLGYAKSKDLQFMIETPTSSWMAYSIDNNYLSYLVKYGVFGLLANIYPLWWGLKIAFKANKMKYVAVFKWFLIIFILYAIDLVTVFQMGEKRIFFILIGIVTTMYKMYGNNKVRKYEG